MMRHLESNYVYAFFPPSSTHSNLRKGLLPLTNHVYIHHHHHHDNAKQ